MRWHHFLWTLTSLNAFAIAEMSAYATNSSHLVLNAIVTHGGHTVFECWKIKAPLVTTSQDGISGAKTMNFASTGSFNYTVIPPHFDGGLHNAPVPQ